MSVDYRFRRAFKDLVLEKSVDKITVKEITDKADVRRTTFYNHYQDKYELMEQIIRQEIVGPIGPLLENDLIDEAIVLIFSNLKKEKEVYMNMARTQGQNSFEQIAGKCVAEILYQVISPKVQAGIDAATFKQNHISADIVATYYASSITFAVMYWINQGMPYTPRQMAEIYDYIFSHSLQDVVDELSDGSAVIETIF